MAIKGRESLIPFYLVDGDRILLIKNEIVQRGNLVGNDGFQVLPPGVLGNNEVGLQTYRSRVLTDPSDTIRTGLLVFPSTVEAVSTYFPTFRTVPPRKYLQGAHQDYSDSIVTRRFAYKLHGLIHISLENMKEI